MEYRGFATWRQNVGRLRRPPGFSLLDSDVLDLLTCQLLAVNGMEDSIFPIEDSVIVATRGR